ncbi:MAG: DNA polymerase ligase N-terminal domain-containing protein [Gemmataceae bacterium]
MPRYVILEHDHPFLHWDLMLEAGTVLRTWRLAAAPEVGHTVTAEPSFDHRLLYLDYEGPISGNRGQVRRWDAGTFTWLTDTENQVSVRLDGRRCQGRLLMECTNEEWIGKIEKEEDSKLD